MKATETGALLGESAYLLYGSTLYASDCYVNYKFDDDRLIRGLYTLSQMTAILPGSSIATFIGSSIRNTALHQGTVRSWFPWG